MDTDSSIDIDTRSVGIGEPIDALITVNILPLGILHIISLFLCVTRVKHRTIYYRALLQTLCRDQVYCTDPARYVYIHGAKLCLGLYIAMARLVCVTLCGIRVYM